MKFRIKKDFLKINGVFELNYYEVLIVKHSKT